MVNILPSSPSNISLTSGATYVTQKKNFLTRCTVFRKSSSPALPAQKYILPLSTSVRLFPQFRIRYGLQSQLKTHKVSATGTDVAVEEADSPAAGNEASEALETPPDAADTSEESSIKSDANTTAAQSKRPRPGRKSEMPPVKNEELIPGATFAGKVRSIQPFGAFVDFGAFTDGLVHVSRLSDSFVKDVNSVVSVGQEVTVRLVEANMETGRISLTMRDSDDTTKLQQPNDASVSSDKSRTPRKSGQRPNQRNEVKKSSKFVKGQDLQGTVKNLTRSGAFISLPEGEEGFLPQSEEADEGFGNIMGGTSLQVGQEVDVRVLRINRGQVTLTMKKEEDAAQFDSALSQGVVHTASNPFVLAFRSNKDISAFLDERTKEEEPTGELEEAENKVDAAVSTVEDTSTEAPEKDGAPESTISDTLQSVDVEAQSVEEEAVEVESKEKASELSSELLAPEGSSSAADQIPEAQSVEEEAVEVESKEQAAEASSELLALEESSSAADQIPEAQSVEEEVVEVESKEQAAQVNSELLAPEGSSTAADQIPKAPSAVDAVENIGESDPPKSLITEEVPEKQSDDVIAKDEIQTETPGEEKEVPLPIQDGQETASSSISTSGQIDVPSIPESPTTEGQVGGELVENEVKDTMVNGKEQIQTPPAEDKTSSAPTVQEEQNSTPAQKETTATGAISPALVKQLREETGAGMMDCKKALTESGGDIIKAQEYLRKKGLASADKKATRATAEGRIGSYIHDSRIGVLIEVNCETDFVSRGEIFKELVDDLAMQVAASPQVQYLVPEDVPKETIDKEREIEMQKEDLLSKPEQIRSKIVDGRIRKRLEELALLEQPYIKNDKVVVRDWVKQTIATIGENIKVKRFVRYNLGEGLEKKSQDFAAEVAAQTASKPSSTPAKDQPPAAEDKEAVEKAPKAAVSAALVKQLREETGAGMMDCKKALSETGGDIEKAQEYLRKKGLSTADKKSSRLAAEGRIGSYIHDSRIGVLIEVNCETDFVGRSEKFKELVDDLAMQVVASPQVQYVSVEDISESIINKEKELEMQREDLQSKPENIREKIVEGRVSKRLGELALLEQPFIKDDSILVKDLVKQTVAALGENIKVRRFVRFTLGESSDQKLEDEA